MLYALFFYNKYETRLYNKTIILEKLIYNIRKYNNWKILTVNSKNGIIIVYKYA
jgi:hypothetical protein